MLLILSDQRYSTYRIQQLLPNTQYCISRRHLTPRGQADKRNSDLIAITNQEGLQYHRIQSHKRPVPHLSNAITFIIVIIMEDSSNSEAPAPAPAPSPAPRRDKFAALASRATTPSGDAGSGKPEDAAESSDPTPAPAPPPPPATDTTTTTSQQAPAPPPRGRDKFSALAARSAAAEVAGTAAPTTASTTTRTTSGRGGGHGNKLAALAAASNRNNNLAAQSPSDGGKTSAESAAAIAEANLAKLKQKLSMRSEILQSLDRAEVLTCKLLSLARETTVALQDINSGDNKQTISELSKAYRATVAELHPLLSSKTTSTLIHPYQNHSYESKHSMYAARVEMRLAQERKQVLKAFADLEPSSSSKHAKETSTETNSNNKRQRE